MEVDHEELQNQKERPNTGTVLFAGINALIAALLRGGDQGLLYIGGALALVTLAVAMDFRKSNNGNGAVWGTMGAHLFLTSFVLPGAFPVRVHLAQKITQHSALRTQNYSYMRCKYDQCY